VRNQIKGLEKESYCTAFSKNCRVCLL